MKKYQHTEEVSAITIAWVSGSMVSANKPSSKKTQPADKHIIILPKHIVHSSPVNVGDKLVFKNDVPHRVMTPAAFDGYYTEGEGEGEGES